MINIQMVGDMAVVPELFLTLAAMALLVVGVIQGAKSARLLIKLSLLALIVGIGLLINVPKEPLLGFHHLFVSSPFILFTKQLVLGAGLLVFISALGVQRKIPVEKRVFEFPILMLFSLVGMLVMLSANDFLTLYIGLELQSLCLYVLAAFDRDNERSTEAGLKYFVLGALASGLLLYGISLIYGFSGTTNFTSLQLLYTQSSHNVVPIGVLVGLILVMTAFCFKLSAAPFHMWTPDVYEGAPTIVTSFFSVAPKLAAVALLVRVLLVPYGLWIDQWQQIIVVVSALSMTVGAFGALRQTNIKRLMAYSSIGHVGYVLMGLASGSVEGVQGILLYMGIYVVMSTGTFACILMMRKKGEGQSEAITDLAGLSKTHPTMAFVLAVFMFSMAGIPPLAGFFGKFYVFLAAIKAGLYLLTIIGVVTSVVAAAYYLRIVKVMYLDNPAEGFEKDKAPELRLVSYFAGAANLGFFLIPAPFVGYAAEIAGLLFS